MRETEKQREREEETRRTPMPWSLAADSEDVPPRALEPHGGSVAAHHPRALPIISHIGVIGGRRLSPHRRLASSWSFTASGTLRQRMEGMSAPRP